MDNLARLSDYRPITCYYVIYKTIAKIITNVMGKELSRIINHSQYTFMLGRNIRDNILLTQFVRNFGDNILLTQFARNCLGMP